MFLQILGMTLIVIGLISFLVVDQRKILVPSDRAENRDRRHGQSAAAWTSWRCPKDERRD